MASIPISIVIHPTLLTFRLSLFYLPTTTTTTLLQNLPPKSLPQNPNTDGRSSSEQGPSPLSPRRCQQPRRPLRQDHISQTGQRPSPIHRPFSRRRPIPLSARASVFSPKPRPQIAHTVSSRLLFLSFRFLALYLALWISVFAFSWCYIFMKLAC